MKSSLRNYVQICTKAGREPDSAEFLAWSFLGIAPEWYEELVEKVESEEDDE